MKISCKREIMRCIRGFDAGHTASEITRCGHIHNASPNSDDMPRSRSRTKNKRGGCEGMAPALLVPHTTYFRIYLFILL